MTKNLTGKTILIVAVLLVFLFGIFGIPKSLSGDGLKQAILSRISLGLDLKGGTHLILQVHVDDAVRAETERAVERLKDALKRANVTTGDIAPDPGRPDAFVVKNVPTDATSAMRNAVSDNLPDWEAASGAQNSWTVTLKNSALTNIRTQAVQQAIETIRNRIDQLGVSEPVIEEHGLGQYQILVQLPGVDDPARVKEIMQSTAMLDIKQVLGGPYASEQEAYQANGGTLPPNSILLPGRPATTRDNGSAPQTVYYVVTRTSAVSGRDLRDAQPTRDENSRPAVRFVLTSEGGRRFAQFTGAHIGDKLGVVLDNKVQEVATIQEQIHDEGRITGNFSEQEAKDLAMVLRSGALPAGIRYLEERTVGPSLGADSIRAGVRAAVIGMIAVLLFMLVYYKGAGINADLALIFNLIILLGVLGFSGATLTLPGIAGLILTVGMGVDSNVLIFERIREELRAGKTAAMAVEQGFSHAWITIVDTHVTTIVSAVILFVFGTGPVKGFAVTLTFGLLANLFTAVFASRVLFDFNLGRHQRGEALSI